MNASDLPGHTSQSPLGSTPSTTTTNLSTPAGSSYYSFAMAPPHDVLNRPALYPEYSAGYAYTHPISTRQALYPALSPMQSAYPIYDYVPHVAYCVPEHDFVFHPPVTAPSPWLALGQSIADPTPPPIQNTVISPQSVDAWALSQSSHYGPRRPVEHSLIETWDNTAYGPSHALASSRMPPFPPGEQPVFDNVSSAYSYWPNETSYPVTSFSSPLASTVQESDLRSPKDLETELEFLKDEWATICIILDSLRNTFRAETSDATQSWRTTDSRIRPMTGVFDSSTRLQGWQVDHTPAILNNPDMQREMLTAYDDLTLQVRQLERKIDRLQFDIRQVTEWSRRQMQQQASHSERGTTSQKRNRDPANNASNENKATKRQRGSPGNSRQV